ncbi:glycosyltransferase family 39 protein [Glycomyces arizonensis]|uniref:glycosyltransferase family 39 protein n=1 Tax=Glycomyces arizonensis TaxID=256035 RepID=UPI00041DB214|nr:glycosyltransferase family 39 protein [Glycomyces arizonensis]
MTDRTPQALPRVARLPLAVAVVVLTAAYAATASQYDYHRDELYFRMLDPAWGYVDQPPLTPLLAHASIAVFGDTLWALRIPAMLCMVGILWLAVLITREFGGGRRAQAVCAGGLAFAGVLLFAGHVLATVSVDVLVWTAVLLFVVRALHRGEPRWWLAAGAVTGVGLYNKHLVVLLLISLAVAILAVGPRSVLRSGWLWAGVGLALVIGSPNLIYQALNDWPQLEMASAIAETEASAKVEVLLFQPLLLTLMTPIWIAGIVALLRRPQWRAARALAVAYPVLLVIVLVAGGQMYYPMGLVVALFAIGCVPTAEWMRRARWRNWTVIAAVAVNSAVSAVIALPLLPVGELGETPLPDINSSLPDQIGWQTYVEQIGEVYRSLPEAEAASAVVLTSNYGEAGAVDRYGDEWGLPEVYSGQNHLRHYGPPEESATVVITVGIPLQRIEGLFESCEAAATLDNGVGVDNEEQGRTVGVCRGPLESWNDLWPHFLHYD